MARDLSYKRQSISNGVLRCSDWSADNFRNRNRNTAAVAVPGECRPDAGIVGNTLGTSNFTE